MPKAVFLSPVLQVVARSDTEIRRLLLKTAAAASADIKHHLGEQTGAVVRRGQFRLAQQALKATLANFWRDAGETIRAGRLDAAVARLDAAFTWDEPLLRRAGVPAASLADLHRSIRQTSMRAVELMIRRFTTQQLSLSRQVYRTRALTNGWIDNLINRALGRGLTARELAAEVRKHIHPDVKGGVSYAAMRLARTEINNAAHAAAIADMIDKPWVLGAEWKLSASHPKQDECDELAHEDKFGLGKGAFPIHEIPQKPHPNCFCFLVPKLLGEDEFIAGLAAGQFDDFLDAR